MASHMRSQIVEDVDAVFSEFEANGAEFTQRVSDKPWGLREFAVRTPDGHRIMFAQEISATDLGE